MNVLILGKKQNNKNIKNIKDTFFHQELEEFSANNLMKNLESLKNLKKLIEKNNIDIVDAFGYDESLFATALFFMHDIPVVLRFEEELQNEKEFSWIFNIINENLKLPIRDINVDLDYKGIRDAYCESTKSYRREGVIDCSLLYYNNKVKKIVDKKKDAVIFGLNPYAQRFLDLLKDTKDYEGKILCVCDDNKQKWGMEYGEFKVISSDEVKEKYLLDKENVQILNLATNHPKIEKKWKDIGFDDVRRMGNFGPEDFQPNFYPDAVNYLLENIQRVEKVYSLLSDDKSREVFSSLVYTRIFQNPDFMVDVCDEVQYFDENIINLSEDEFFIDGGSFIAETTKNLLDRTGGKLYKVYAFEPDERIYHICKSNLSSMLEESKFEAVKGGLYDKTTKLGFNIRKPGASKVDDKIIDEDESILVYSLDELLKEEGHKLTFIKMDIEGSESKAIKGSKEILKQDMPKLGICIYHLPEDIIEIPLLIKSYNEEYKIYFRHYSMGKSESVVYSI